MNLIKKAVSTFVVGATLFGAGLGTVEAKVTELVGNEYLSIGVNATHTPESYAATKRLVEGEQVTDENIVVVDGNVINKYLQDGSNASTNVWSSSKIKFNKGFTGVKVHIVTPSNIQKVTADTYINAAITSGISNADIVVASETPVTGEGALAGIYAIMEQKGVMSKETAQLAQEEIELIANTGNDQEVTNAVMSQVKAEVAQAVQNGDIVNGDKVVNIVNNVVNNYGLQLDDSTKQAIADFALKFSQSDSVKSEEVVNQLNNLSKDIFEKGGDLFKNASSKLQEKWDDPEVQEQAKGFFASVMDAIKSFFDFLGSLFS